MLIYDSWTHCFSSYPVPIKFNVTFVLLILSCSITVPLCLPRILQKLQISMKGND